MLAGAKHREKGQTIVLVALSVVTLLAMAALAIDVVTLYVARAEAQRAADAAALAGAKAFADSGVTTDPTNPALQTLAQNMANAGINAILQQNKMGGTPPVLASAPTFDFAQPGDPQVTVTLQRTDLPTFFARIWGKRLASVTATATAEAYNPSNSQTITGNYIPIQPKCVKPLLIPNADPTPGRGGAPFINVSTGAVAPGLVGESFTLQDACPPGNPNVACITPPFSVPPPPPGKYLPAVVTSNPGNLCPSCQGASNLEQSIECCDFNAYRCGGTTPNATVDTIATSRNVRREADNGLQCLINASGSGPGQGQDVLDASNFPNGPMQITASSGPQSGNLVTTSRSIATFPVFDNTAAVPPGGSVTVVGFIQGFINYEVGIGNSTQVNLTILNVAGCGNSPGAGAAVSGGGYSVIPVRLIHQ
jgi:hypothetical protein